ncbi:MAG: glycoside hydrolase family 78 protein, partial [Candidatus Thorarchaeota archaeon]
MNRKIFKKGFVFFFFSFLVLSIYDIDEVCSATLYVDHVYPDNTSFMVYGSNWSAQSFTTSDVFTVTSVDLKLYRIGNPGTITVSIRETDGDGYPTGNDLCSGTYDGNTITTDTDGVWYEIAVGDGADLSDSTKYAIVVRATSGDFDNKIGWRADDSNDYSYGRRDYSNDSGSSWDPLGTHDMLFRVWGNPTNTTPSADTPTVQGYSSSPQKDHITDSTPTLGWTFNDNGDGDTQSGFEVEVWTGSGGTGTNMLDTGEQVSTAQSYTYDDSALSDGSTYYYRVKVKDSQGTWSDWSELSFTMNTEPTAPSLSSPADGSETTDTTPDLVVNNGTDAESDTLTYYFEIDTADTFDTANKQNSSGVSEGASTTTWTVPNALTDNTVWYWRCRSYDGYEYSSWMTTVSIVVNTANDSPNAFDLSSPDDASTVTTTPALIWEVSTDPDPNDTVTYTVEIDDTDSTFSSPEVTKTDLTSNSYDV